MCFCQMNVDRRIISVKTALYREEPRILFRKNEQFHVPHCPWKGKYIHFKIFSSIHGFQHKEKDYERINRNPGWW